MTNKIIKNLIVLGTVAFSFIFINKALAFESYWTSSGNYDEYMDTGYYTTRTYPNDYQLYNTNSGTTTSGTRIVNNYYYQTNPASTSSNTSTTSTVKTTSDNQNFAYNTTSRNVSNGVNNGSNYSNSGYNNSNGNLGASAYTGYSYGYNNNQGSNITALSWKGSGGFMPSSLWQWIVVVILILAIIIISRMIIHRKTVVLQEVHTNHAH